MVEPSLVLYGAPYERAVEVLEETLRETGARYALLIDRKGFVLAHKEALWAPKPPPLDPLATLVASNAAATQALAKGTEAFAAQRMNRGIQQALAGRKLEEV